MSNRKITEEQAKRILLLKEAGVSSRKIAKLVLGSESKKSTVNDFLNRNQSDEAPNYYTLTQEGGTKLYSIDTIRWSEKLEDVAEALPKLEYDPRDVAFNRKTPSKVLTHEDVRAAAKVGNESFEKMFGGVKPRIALIDVETSPIIAHIWSIWQQGVGLNQVQSDWHLLSFCAKWLGEDEIIYQDQRDVENIEDDRKLLDTLWTIMNEADIIIGQNLRRFDVKKINARFIMNGYPKPSSFRVIDTMEIAKKQFGFTSNKLEYMTDKLCTTYKKSKHKKFVGHELWSECLKGNLEAWEEMEEYNRLDVLSLEELYNILSSWDNTLPNFDVFVDEVLDMSVWEKDGFVYSNLGKYQRYRNKETGVQRRSRVNLLSKEKRQSLLANII